MRLADIEGQPDSLAAADRRIFRQRGQHHPAAGRPCADHGLVAQPLDQIDGAGQPGGFGRGQPQALRADPEDQRLGVGDARAVEVKDRRGEIRRADLDRAAVPARPPDRQQVHLRRSDETGDEQVLGTAVDVERPPDLPHLALVEHHDLVGQRHRLDLVVGDVDHSRAQFLVQPRDFHAHVHPQRGVQVGQRLVEQEQPRVADDGAADGDALALAAGQLRRLAVEQILHLQDARGLADLRLALGREEVAEAKREADVLAHRHVRVQRVGLEHHRDATVARGDVVAQLAVDVEIPARDLLETGDHPQQRRFSATRRTDEDHELAMSDLEIDALDDPDRAKHLFDAPELHLSHLSSPQGRRFFFRFRPGHCACPARPSTGPEGNGPPSGARYQVEIAAPPSGSDLSPPPPPGLRTRRQGFNASAADQRSSRSPPSTGMIWPVIHDDRPVARNSTTSAISSGVPQREMG
jgi:hypothetical protein